MILIILNGRRRLKTVSFERYEPMSNYSMSDFLKMEQKVSKTFILKEKRIEKFVSEGYDE